MRPFFSLECIMSNDAKQTAKQLADGLKRLGPDRVVALSVHKTKELIEELEEKAKRLVEQLDAQ